jgi:iron complex transport system substrate-binding protein
VPFDTNFVQLYHPRAMFQRRMSAIFAGIFLLAMAHACDENSGVPATKPAPSRVTVASLVPAATDLIINMHAGDQLVAISNYDPERAETSGLPRVGDYLNNDWEKLAQVRPGVMITQYDPDRMPKGLRERAGELGIKLVNVKIERVEDIIAAIQLLGTTLNQQEKARAASDRMRQQLAAIRSRVENLQRVRTLVVLDDSGQSVAGPDTFLDDLVTIAGGENVLAGNRNRYPRIDREMLVTLAPDAIRQLQPEATAQRLEQARQFWRSVPDVPAVKNGRVYTFTDWYVLQPAFEMGALAEQFANALHPIAGSSQPSEHIQTSALPAQTGTGGR